jgi:ABC-2 type transport system permease protein
MTVFLRFARDRRRSNLWWLLGTLALVLFTVLLFPSIHGQANYDDLTKDLPESLKTLFGIDNAVPISSAPGYFNVRLFSSLWPFVLLVYAISVFSSAIGGSEEDGTLEFILANPVTRRRVLFERYASSAALLAGIAVVFSLALVATLPLVDGLDHVSIAGLIAACIAAPSFALLHGSIAFAAGSATGRRAPALAASAGVAVAGYLAYGVLAATSIPSGFLYVTPWYWYLHENMLATGANVLPIALPLALSAVALLVGAFAFERRDLR